MHGIPTPQTNVKSTKQKNSVRDLAALLHQPHKLLYKALVKVRCEKPHNNGTNQSRAECDLTPSIVQFTKNHCISTLHTKADCTQVLASRLHTRSTKQIAPSEPKQSRVRPDSQRHLSAPHPDLIVCMPYACDTAVINIGGKNLKITTFSFSCPVIPHSE